MVTKRRRTEKPPTEKKTPADSGPPMMDATSQIFGTALMRGPNSWSEWLNDWHNSSLAQRLGLLESALPNSTTPFDKISERIRFFLTLSELPLTTEGRFDGRNSLIEKATDVLIRKVFIGTNFQSHEPPWRWLLDNEVIFESVLWYFRPQFYIGRIAVGAICRVESKEVRVQMSSFLHALCQKAWMDEACVRYPWLVQTRPQIVPILCGLGGKAIWEAASPDGIIKFDPACLKALEKTILATKVALPTEGTYYLPKSIEEAVFCGLECARVYLILQAMAKEKNRRFKVEEQKQRLSKLRNQIKETEQQITNLGGSHVPDRQSEQLD